jgi:trehalose transport system substrate-binding protein
MNTSKTNSVLNVSLQAMKEGVFLRDPVQWISEWQNLIDNAWTQIIVDHGNYSKIPSILSSENSSMYSYLLSTYNYTVAHHYEMGHYKPISV